MLSAVGGTACHSCHVVCLEGCSDICVEFILGPPLSFMTCMPCHVDPALEVALMLYPFLCFRVERCLRLRLHLMCPVGSRVVLLVYFQGQRDAFSELCLALPPDCFSRVHTQPSTLLKFLFSLL